MPDRLLSLDAETTGVDPYRDRIIEVSFYAQYEVAKTWRVNPGVPIPAGATAVHGIRDQDVADEPPFAAIAPEVQALLKGSVLVTFNGRRFDTPLVDAELRRAGQPGLPRHADGRLIVPEIDAYALWSRCEDRKLVTAARRFAGVDLTDAHSAEADTRVLAEVLSGMMLAFGLQGASMAELCALCVPEDEVDRDRKFKRGEDGTIVFAFGKNEGQPVAKDPGYLQWMMGKDFSAETKAFARRFLREIAAAAGTERATPAAQGALL